MPHGTPDWGLVGPKATTFGLDDLGEHAVRLGSPHFFDRRGDTLLLTDFRDGIGDFDSTGDGVGWDTTLVTLHSRTGPYAVRVTTLGGIGNKTGLVARFSYPLLSSLGLEFSFGSNLKHRWQGWLDWYTGARQYLARMRVHDDTGLLQYSTGVGLWAEQAILGELLDSSRPLNTLKFVVDPTLPDPEFVRAMFNSNSESMAGVPVPWVADILTVPHLVVYIYLEDTRAAPAVGYLDNIIVTHNEP